MANVVFCQSNCLCYILWCCWQRLHRLSNPQLRPACQFRCQRIWFSKKKWPSLSMLSEKEVENCSLMLSAVQPRSDRFSLWRQWLVDLPLSVRKFSLQCMVVIYVWVAFLECVHKDLCKLRPNYPYIGENMTSVQSFGSLSGHQF